MILYSSRWSEAELDSLMRQASMLGDTGEKVEFISRQFLGTAYRESTLVGTMDTEEVLVINLEGVDCFTLLDYVEAMRISSSPAGFKNNVAKVRYHEGRISFSARNHFFTDWGEYGAGRIDDVTRSVGGIKTEKVVKILNVSEDGSYLVAGLEPRMREICFVPSDALDEGVIKRLQTGDYVGIYSRRKGLDVSHAGIVIKAGGSVYLRHASSAEGRRKVLDEDLRRYISARPGLVVLRPKG
jgi:N-acetylmuramoyl-L-alanine amidase-like